MSFLDLGLSPALRRAVDLQGFSEPTPVQAQAIPAILAGRDVLALAQTGSGKTAAFGLPLLQKLQATTPASGQGKHVLHTLVLVPTRELAAQVGEMLGAISQHLELPVKTTVIFGGVSTNKQMMGLRSGTHVLVATPGRLLDLVEKNAINLSTVATLVLDEADRLLDLGFAEELNRLLAMLPRQRQNLFFSATFAPAVQALANGLLHKPLRIEIAATSLTLPKVAQTAIWVDAPKRTQLLRHLVQQPAWDQVLVFVATKHAAEMVADKLRKGNITAEPFHGLLSQGKRSQVLIDFKLKRVRVVVATDLAARGLDIAQLPVVVNYDLPRSSDDYTHRIGRTARAGVTGSAVSFVSPATLAHFRLIEKRHGLAIALDSVAGYEPQEAPQVFALQGAGGIKGHRLSKKDKLRAAAAVASSAIAAGPAKP